MTDRGWQHAVLRDIGVSISGLVTAEPPPHISRPSPAPAGTPSPLPVPLAPPEPHVAPPPTTDPSETIHDGLPILPEAETAASSRQQTMTFRRPEDLPGPAHPKAPPPPAPSTYPYWYTEPSLPADPEAEPGPEPQPAAEPEPGIAEPHQATPAWYAAEPSVSGLIGAPVPPEPEPPRAPVQSPPPPQADPYAQQPVPPQADPYPQWPGPPQANPAAYHPAPEGSGPGPGPLAPQSAGALVRRNPHGDPLIRRIGDKVRRAVGTSATSDAREQAAITAMLARPVPTCRQLAIVSIRGGAGKTTLAALIGAAIAEHRDDRVLVVDADPELGSLPLRLGVRPERSMRDLARANPRSWEEATGYLSQANERLWVLSGSATGGMDTELELGTFRAAFGGVGRYFSTSVIDCGAGILGGVQAGMFETAHAQVLVTPSTVDGALSARRALDWFADRGHTGLLSRTVISLVAHTPRADADLDRVNDLLGAGGRPVIHLPYDRHLATGTSIEMSRVGAGTRTAAIRLAAEVFTRSLAGTLSSIREGGS